MDPTALTTAIRYFPLIGRPRPACPPLTMRVQEITDIAHTARTASQQGDDALHHAAHALNKAALLMSDCGMTEPAAQLCWHHIDIYRAKGQQLTMRQARYMLEPATNLARLHLRSNNPNAALLILQAMNQAVRTNTDLLIDGQRLALAGLTGPQEDRRKLREWVWLQLLSEGTRAYILADRWTEANTLAETNRGIGAHLLEGRQIAILTPLLHDTPGQARHLLDTTTRTEPWEHQVASCLEVMCRWIEQRAPSAAVEAMMRQLHDGRPGPGSTVSRTRLGLTAAALSDLCTSGIGPNLLTQVTDEAIAVGDGYAARDILKHCGPELPPSQQRSLHAILAACGLEADHLPPELQRAITRAVTTAASALADSLQANPHGRRRA